MALVDWGRLKMQNKDGKRFLKLAATAAPLSTHPGEPTIILDIAICILRDG
mgnify:CR=1 FL=1